MIQVTCTNRPACDSEPVYEYDDFYFKRNPEPRCGNCGAPIREATSKETQAYDVALAAVQIDDPADFRSAIATQFVDTGGKYDGPVIVFEAAEALPDNVVQFPRKDGG